MSEVFTVEQIANNLTSSKFAINGISPEVYRQNQHLFEALGTTAASMDEHVISVQVLGSRVHGTAGLESDIDMTVVTLGETDRQGICDEFSTVAEGFGLEVDFDRVTDMVGIKNTIPCEARPLLSLVRNENNACISVFEEGIHQHPNLLLARLAVLKAMYYGYNSVSDNYWGDIRTEHAETYLGEACKIIAKLVERRGRKDGQKVSDLVTPEEISIFGAVRERYKKFGLPKYYSDYYVNTVSWFDQNEPKLKRFQGYELYQEMVELTKS